MIGVVLMVAIAVVLAAAVTVPGIGRSADPLPPCGHNHHDPGAHCDPVHPATLTCVGHLHVVRSVDWAWSCGPPTRGGGGGGGPGAPLDACTGPGTVHDPGHPYEDVDNDATFTAGRDVAISPLDIADGSHQVADPDHGLVIPLSTGGISAGTIDLAAGTGSGILVVDVDMNALVGDIVLTSGGNMSLGNRLVVSDIGRLTVTAGGCLEAEGLVAEAAEHVEFTAAHGIAMDGAAAVSLSGRLTVASTGPGADVEAAGAVLESQDLATVLAGRHLRADGLAAASGLSDVGLGTAVAGSGNASLRDALVTAQRDIDVDVGGHLDAVGIRASNGTGHVRLNATGGWLDVSDGLVGGGDEVELLAEGNVTVARASVFSASSTILLDARDASRTIDVTDASFKDDNDVAQAAPDGVNVVGTPSSGSVDYVG